MPRRVGISPASAPSSGPVRNAASVRASAVPSGTALVNTANTSSSNDIGTTLERRRLSTMRHKPNTSMP